MIVDIISLLFTCTVIPALSIGFMVYVTITQFRLEKRFEQMREERRLVRAELDALRTRLKDIEIAKKEAERYERQSADGNAEEKESGPDTARIADSGLEP